MRPQCRVLGGLVVKAIVWSICLAKNDCIFNAHIMYAHALMLKIDHMLLSWFSTAAERTRVKLEDSISTIQRSLEFLGPRVESKGILPSEVTQEQNKG